MSKELCRPCGQTFTSTTAGDLHRVGDHAVSVGPNRRRCLTVEEMEARGMVRNQRGHWMTRAATKGCYHCGHPFPPRELVDGWCPDCTGRNTIQIALPVEARNDEQDGRGGLAQQMILWASTQYGTEVE